MSDEGTGQDIVVASGAASITLRLTTAEAAKTDVQRLRSQKQQFVLKRRELDNQLAELRADHQALLGKLGSTYQRPIPGVVPEKRGCLAILFGKPPQKTHYTKEDERRLHAEAVSPLEGEKAQVKDAILAIDQAIVRLQQFIAESPPPEKPKRVSAGRTAQKKFCTACGAERSTGQQFCAECGNKFDA